MNPEELAIIEKRLKQGIIKRADVQKLVDAVRSGKDSPPPPIEEAEVTANIEAPELVEQALAETETSRKKPKSK